MANTKLQLEVEVDSSGAIRGLQVVQQAVKGVSDEAKKVGETSGFEGFAERIKGSIENPLRSAGDAAKALVTSLGPVGTGIAAAAGVLGTIATAGFEAAKSLGELGTSVNNISIRTGLSAKEVGQFSFAAKLAGADVSVFETAMRTLSKGLADNSADGAKSRQALADMGVSARNSEGQLRPMAEILLEVSEGLDKVHGQANRAAAAQEIFGRAGLELLPVMDHLAEKIGRAKDLGYGLSDEQVKRFETYHQTVVELEKSWESLARKVKEPLAATVLFTIKWFTEDDGKMDPKLKQRLMGGAWAPTVNSEAGAADRNFGGLAFSGTPTAQNYLTNVYWDRGAPGFGAGVLGDIQKWALPTAASSAQFMTQADANIAAFMDRKTEMDRLRAQFGVTKAGIEEAYQQAAKDAKDARDKYFGGDFSDSAKKNYLDTAAIAERLKNQLEAMNKAEALSKQIDSILAKFSGIGENPLTKLVSEANAEIAKTAGDPRAAEVRQAATLAVYREAHRIIAEQIAKSQAEADKWTEVTLSVEASGARMNEEFAKSFAQSAGIKQPEHPPTGLGILNRAANELYPESLDHLLAVTQAQEKAQEQIVGFGRNEVANADAVLQLRLDLAAKERDIADAKARALDNEFERNRALANDKFDYEQKLFQAQTDHTTQLLALRQRAEDDYVKTVETAFQSLISGRRGAMRSLLESQAMGVATTIVGNVARETYRPGLLQLPESIIGTAKEPTFLGSLLKGTPFGADPAKAADIQLSAAGIQLTAAKTFNAAVSAMAGGTASYANAIDQLGLPTPAALKGLQPAFPSSFAQPLEVSEVPQTLEQNIKRIVEGGGTRRSPEPSNLLATSSPAAAADNQVRSANPAARTAHQELALGSSSTVTQDVTRHLVKDVDPPAPALQDIIRRVVSSDDMLNPAPGEAEQIVNRALGADLAALSPQQQSISRVLTADVSAPEAARQNVFRFLVAELAGPPKVAQDVERRLLTQTLPPIDPGHQDIVRQVSLEAPVPQAIGQSVSRIVTADLANPEPAQQSISRVFEANLAPPAASQDVMRRWIVQSLPPIDTAYQDVVRRVAAEAPPPQTIEQQVRRIVGGSSPEPQPFDPTKLPLDKSSFDKVPLDRNNQALGANTAALQGLAERLADLSALNPSGSMAPASGLPGGISSLFTGEGWTGPNQTPFGALSLSSSSAGDMLDQLGLPVSSIPSAAAPRLGASWPGMADQLGLPVSPVPSFGLPDLTLPNSTNPVASFLRGATSLAGGGNVWKAITGDDYSIKGPGGVTTTASSQGLTTGAARAGSIIGAAGAVFAGTEGVISGIKEGGARGTLGAIGSAAGTAAALDPEPISKAVLAGVALGSQVVSALLGDPRQNRAKDINNELLGAHRDMPTAQTYTMDTYGRAIDYNYQGQARQSVINNWNVSTMDSQSFADFLGQNGPTVANVVSGQLTTHGPLQQGVRSLANPT